MVEQHDVQISGATLQGTSNSTPVLVARTDQDFLNAVFREYKKHDVQDHLGRKSKNATEQNPLVMYPPVQRIMHLALTEVFCAVPGNPRLDPLKIESAGVVIRRVPVDKNHRPILQYPGASAKQSPPPPLEVWQHNSEGGIGWVQLSQWEHDDDPDPKRRPLLHTGQPYLDDLLHQKLNAAQATEAVAPAFAAPPDVCAEAQKTLVFAVLQLSSSELSTAPSALQDYGNSIASHLSALITPGNKMAPLAGRKITHEYASEESLRNDPIKLDSGSLSQFKTFLTFLNSMVVEFGIFEDKPESATMLNTLNRFSVTVPDDQGKTHKQALGEFLRTAKAVLIDYDPNNKSQNKVDHFYMPKEWPQITNAQFSDIVQAAKGGISARISSLRGNEGRFQDPSRLYRLRVFLRVKNHEQCPPKIVWSNYSAPFRIAPWYEAPDPAPPPVPVVLPDPTNRDELKKLKPNVAFSVPSGLFGAMQGNSLPQLLLGLGGGGDSPVDWICGFNIPIITICAFLMLNIFLSLLNIVFFWLPFVKICIPIPKGTIKGNG